MAELLEAVASWQTLLLVLLVFGFAPGFVLRLLVLAYPRSDPRRQELIAELYAVPRIQRPLWVAEQLEVALFEALGHRVTRLARQMRRRGKRQARSVDPVKEPLTLAEFYRLEQPPKASDVTEVLNRYKRLLRDSDSSDQGPLAMKERGHHHRRRT